MVEITFRVDSRQRLSSVFATGHADSGPYPQDIVCAAVSAILQAAYAGLQEVAKIDLSGQTRSAGNLAFTIGETDRDRPDVAAIVRTAEVSLEQIARQYPAFVRVGHAPES